MAAYILVPALLVGNKLAKTTPCKYPNLGDCLESLMSGPSGYAAVSYKYKKYLVHRLTFAAANNLTLEDLSRVHVLHHCDNPKCINPLHLFAGTALDNMRDRNTKGRANMPKGVDHYRAKLTASDVLELRSLYRTGKYTQAELGKLYGITGQVAGKAATGQTWKHL